MASLLKRPLIAGALMLFLISLAYARALFFASGDRRYVFTQSWGSEGTGPGEFKDPIGVAIGPSGDIYVTDTGNNRIQRFQSDGTFVTGWGERGGNLGQLDRPMHAVFGPDGYLYVAEYLNDRIQVFTEHGKAVRALGTSGSEPGMFDAPGGVAVASNSDVYVADFYNHRAHRLEAGGDVLGILGSSGRVIGGALHYPLTWQCSRTAVSSWPTPTTIASRSSKPMGAFGKSGAVRSASVFPAGGPDGSVSQPASRLDLLVVSTWPTFITTESRCSHRPEDCSACLPTLASSSTQQMSWLPRMVLSTSSTLVTTE